MVEWVGLFKELVNRNIATVFLRVLLYMYSNQSCKVSWNGKYSDKFSVTAGVRQGMPSSGLLFNCVADFLIARLRKHDVGLTLFGRFLGVWIYCDDIVILSSSRNGLQSMVTTCEMFAKENNMKFSSNVNVAKSKTKCLIFSKKKQEEMNVDRVILNNNELPWVEQIKHVGNMLQCDNSFRADCLIKRGQFIGKIHSLQQEFPTLASHVKMKLIDIYTLSFYGSPLWNLFGPEVAKINKSYNVATRIAFNVNRATRSFLIEQMTGCFHPHTLLCSRYIKFHLTNKSCQKPSIRMLATVFENDQRTRYGQNLRNIANACQTNISQLTPLEVNNKVRYCELPEDEHWRIPILTEMLAARDNNTEIDGLSQKDIRAIINYVCTV